VLVEQEGSHYIGEVYKQGVGACQCSYSRICATVLAPVAPTNR